MIILSHTPKHDWSSDSYNNKWIYVNGHNHRNEYFKNDDRGVYADNQIGYTNANFKAKLFISSRKYDIFAYLDDGVYNIDYNEETGTYEARKTSFTTAPP